MTYPAPDVLPYDEWFDPNYKYNPLDSMPIATNKSDDPEWDTEDIKDAWIDAAEQGYDSIHEKMYRLATAHGKHTLGGSEEHIE